MAKEEKKREDKSFYLKTIRSVVEGQKELLGKDVALMKARQAPLEIDKDNEINDFYGTGKDTLDTLADQYGEVWGEKVAQRKIRHTIENSVSEEDYERLPEEMRPRDNSKGLIGSIIRQLRGGDDS